MIIKSVIPLYMVNKIKTLILDLLHNKEIELKNSMFSHSYCA